MGNQPLELRYHFAKGAIWILKFHHAERGGDRRDYECIVALHEVPLGYGWLVSREAESQPPILEVTLCCDPI